MRGGGGGRRGGGRTAGVRRPVGGGDCSIIGLINLTVSSLSLVCTRIGGKDIVGA